MDNKLKHKGYIIKANTSLLKTGEWNTEIEILKDKGNEIIGKPFVSKNTYKTKDSAIIANLIFGKKIIDGDIPGCSVDF